MSTAPDPQTTSTSRLRWVRSKAAYLVFRVRGFRGRALWRRATTIARAHRRNPLVVLADMLFWAAFRDTNFQDYQDWDFVVLTTAERRTYVTNAISNHIAMEHNAVEDRAVFHDKIRFNEVFADHLGRAWLRVEDSSVDEVRAFAERFGLVMGKVPFSNSGYGVERYATADVRDWAAFRRDLLAKGQTLLEEWVTTQHPVLAEVCPTTVNTTRVTTFFDGDRVHVLSMAQKFGRGQASDQQSFGGFFTLLDEEGRSKGPGYGSHQLVYDRHPDSGVSISGFQLPLHDAVVELVERAGRLVPSMRYIGWDIIVGADGPILLEGNWTPGAYENKPTATGLRTGTLPRFREVIGF